MHGKSNDAENAVDQFHFLFCFPMADERWERLAEQQGIAYAKTVAEAMKLKLDMDNLADREKLRRAIPDLVAGRKMPKQKGHG